MPVELDFLQFDFLLTHPSCIYLNKMHLFMPCFFDSSSVKVSLPFSRHFSFLSPPSPLPIISFWHLKPKTAEKKEARKKSGHKKAPPPFWHGNFFRHSDSYEEVLKNCLERSQVFFPQRLKLTTQMAFLSRFFSSLLFEWNSLGFFVLSAPGPPIF